MIYLIKCNNTKLAEKYISGNEINTSEYDTSETLLCPLPCQ